jgi:hypothetical protein
MGKAMVLAPVFETNAVALGDGRRFRNQNPMGENAPVRCAIPTPKPRNARWGNPPLQASAETPTTFYISGRSQLSWA